MTAILASKGQKNSQNANMSSIRRIVCYYFSSVAWVVLWRALLPTGGASRSASAVPAAVPGARVARLQQSQPDWPCSA